MRPTTMLQQNNNNNYPCLNVSGSTREMLQKCSRASLPFPSRLELGDLPLIRGLRAWALCSKNRRKAGGLLGGGQAPAAPPASRSGLTSCPRPADVYLSGEWGRMGYGLPLGLDAGQTGIGALVTVATLKTSEGSGKTQTQCLFLRTEKGSCLYSTAKPASTVVGGWLRGKTGGGGSRDTPAGRRDHGPSAQTGANRVRVRSGRRWRKSCNAAAGREKAGVSRERQQDTAGEIALEERQEGGPESKQSPSLQQDIRRPLRSPRCCHNASPKTCSQCGRRAPRRENQDDHEGGESPRRGRLNGEVKAMRKDREKKEEEEEEKGDPDPESNCCHAESHSGRGGEEIREISEEMKTQTSHSEGERSEKVEDSYSGPPEPNDFGSRQNREFEDTKPVENVCEEIVPNGNGFSDHAEALEGSEKDLEEEGGIKQAPNEVSVVPASPESSAPIGGSTCTADHKSGGALREQDNNKEVSGCEIMGKEELDFSTFEQQDAICAADEINSEKQLLCLEEDVESSVRLEEVDASSSPLRHGDPSIPERDGRILTENSGGEDRGDEPVWENREKELHVENIEQRVKPAGVGNAFWGRESTCDEWHAEEDIDDSTEHAATQNCALDDGWRLQESADVLQDGGTCGRASAPQTNGETGTDVTNVACADPSTSPVLAPANPAPSLPPLGSMATSLPRLEAAEEEEEEGEGLVVTAGDGGGEGGQEGKRRHGRELEQQGEEERGSTVATEEARKEEEEEDEFGVFMQAEGEPAWSEGSTMPASVPCGSRESVALGNHAMSGESTLWTPGWTDSSFHQSDDSWSAFPQDSSAERRDVVGQWWPTSAVEESRVRLLTNHSLASVFAEAFPSLPASSSSDACDLDTVPTLTQLLRGKASQDQGLLDSFHDLNKMICQRYKRANGASRDLLLKTLHLEQPHTESRPAPRTVNRRLSPGLPSANQHAQNAAAKRRLSYDYNRNIME